MALTPDGRLVKQILENMAIKAPPRLDACLRLLEKPEVMGRGLVPAEVVSLLDAIRSAGLRGQVYLSAGAPAT